MLVFREGNLFDEQADIQINTVNCVGVMGKGVALAFKERYPAMFDAYKKACNRGEVQPGRLHTWAAPEGITVVNFPTKRHWRQKSRYEDIESGLNALHEYLKERGRVRVTLPALGCGHGGLDWGRVSQLIQDRLEGLEAEIHVFSPSASRKADSVSRTSEEKENRELLKQRGVRILCEDALAFPPSLREQGYRHLYLLGNEELLSEKLVTFLCSNRPAEREINAIAMCADGLSHAGVVIGTGYGSKADRRAIHAALDQGGNVVIFLTDGILKFRRHHELHDVWDANRIAVLSVASPNQPWIRDSVSNARRAMIAISSCVLVTDPEPYHWWATAKRVPSKRSAYFAFVDYKSDTTDMRTMMELGAIPVRRSRSNGTPNLNPIIERVKGLIEMNDAKPDLVSISEESALPVSANSLKYPKRLIEVDLPIARISAHARREKSIRHGHISTLHIWWARRPLAACRAVICAALWPDPADELCPQAFREAAVEQITTFANRVFPKKITEEGRQLASEKHCSPQSRARWEAIAAGTLTLNATEAADMPLLRMCLLDFIADFANWDNSTVPAYLETSRALTQAAHEALGGVPGTRPLVVDPFAGGGSIPFEALRIGADAFASDLNPVAVLLNKVVLEYIPKYGQRLADEVRKWGQWIKEQAEKELAEFYPLDPDGATPIAYLWARTVLSEAPGQGNEPIEIPLIRSMWLCKKPNRRVALRFAKDLQGQVITDTIDVKSATGNQLRVRRPRLEIFEPQKASDVREGTVARGSATCPVSGFTTPLNSVKQQLKSRFGGGSDARLLCVVVKRKGESGRQFRLPTQRDLNAIESAEQYLQSNISPDEVPTESTQNYHTFVNRGPIYGMTKWKHYFTPRQLVALAILARCIRRLGDASSGLEVDSSLRAAVETCLTLAFGKQADLTNSLCRWEPIAQCPRQLFCKQAIGMVWDFAEGVPTSDSSGAWGIQVSRTDHVLEAIGYDWAVGTVQLASAVTHPLPSDSVNALVTDPPYYYSVQYADLADFFYVWFKRILSSTHPELFGTPLISKGDEIIVQSPGHEFAAEGKNNAFYEAMMTRAMADSRRLVNPPGIGIVVFAHTSTSGWESQLQAMVNAGWTITGSWPIDTEMASRVIAQGRSVLASSVHLIIRPRENQDGELRDEVGEWRDVLSELPIRIHQWMPRLAAEGVVGADAIFACLGPALEIFSRYSRVEKANGEAVPLREYLEHVWAAVSTEALSLIFKDADAAGLEPDARLTAMWLWTLGAGTGKAGGSAQPIEVVPGMPADDEEDAEPAEKAAASSGYTLEFDAARKIAQGLGIHLEQSERIVEVKGDKARLLPVSERTAHLFGKQQVIASSGRKRPKAKQQSLFEELDTLEAEAEAAPGELKPEGGATVLDRVHQAMILFASGRGEALRRFLVDDGAGKDARFWKLAQSLSALYPPGTDEKRWVDGVLARKKGLGL